MKIKPTSQRGEVTMRLKGSEADMLAPKALPPFSISTILVPFDFSKFSEKSFRYAQSFGRLCGAKVVLLHVVEPRIYPENYFVIPAEMEEVNLRLAAEAKAKLEAIAAANTDEKCATEAAVRMGRPYEEITEAARELKAELIVVATHGHTGLKHVLLGSTAERVARHARCPVLVVRDVEREFLPGEAPSI